ncbi:MAG: hypothetical protein GY845_10135 [Planctomycetes bacterium]|nr:hypothetical protein [Planctomycetota bacterium]
MPKKIADAKKEQWFDEYQNGKTEAAIARGHSVDRRTIFKAIEDVSRKREAQAARASLLYDVLRNHQNDLLYVLGEVLQNIQVPLPSIPEVAWDSKILSPSATESAIPNNAGDNYYSNIENYLSYETKDEWSMLKEHLKDDPFWKALMVWRSELVAYLPAKIDLQRAVMALLEKETGCKPGYESDTLPYVFASSTATLVYNQAINIALKKRDEVSLESNIKINRKNGEVRYGTARSLLGKAPVKDADKLREGILETSRKLQTSPDLSHFVATHKTLTESGARASQAGKEILLLGMVPGKCRVCRRLGL